MSRFLRAFVFLLALSGCATPPASTQSFARAGKLDSVSEADIVAAVSAAEHSGYFPGKRVSLVKVESRSKISVYYGSMSDMAGFFVAVERVHGHWQAMYQGAWNA